MADKKDNRAEDIRRTFIAKMVNPIAKTIVSFIPVWWIKENQDLLGMGFVVAWVINLILPNQGTGQDLSDLQSQVAEQVPEMAKDKVRDWEKARNELKKKRLKKIQEYKRKADAKKLQVDDTRDKAEIEEIQKIFSGISWDKAKKKLRLRRRIELDKEIKAYTLDDIKVDDKEDYEEIRVLCDFPDRRIPWEIVDKKLEKILNPVLEKIADFMKGIDWKKFKAPKFSAILSFPKKIETWMGSSGLEEKANIFVRKHKPKPLCKPSKLSKWIDSLGEK